MSSSLRTTLPTLLALLFGYALMQMGNTLQGTLLSVRGHLDGFSTTEIGAVGAAFWVGIVLGSLWAGRVIQQVGHTRAFAALAAVAATAALLHLLVVQPVLWIGARALTGARPQPTPGSADAQASAEALSCPPRREVSRHAAGFGRGCRERVDR